VAPCSDSVGYVVLGRSGRCLDCAGCDVGGDNDF